ncbi:DUF3124 domain-containing protein [Seonamhaeicola marinus]|uniref:DUF3124 domain-containing protein n=1 Tax=Seonamhaeicola marinus TaxID=1912246 RepID=A0A5D0HKT2_9FLAO|nr:DUF3124 domain-containing protein [Seonamhaeicola marinus]TYA71580.1 DUF3124 domain-containing protein [Seonamhaeicola marinus]
MRYCILLLLLLTVSCNEEPNVQIHKEDWSKRKANITKLDSLDYGKSYLSVYSQIYSFSQKQKYNLTGMISLRNVSEEDTIYLLRADYFNTKGKKIRTYFDYPVFIDPMETLEIVIAQADVEGGTGSNFLFDWKIPKGCPEPLFEGVMNSMQGTQGISFTTHAKRIK